MEKEKKRKKAILIVKITIALAIFSLVVLFSIIIAQTIIINQLQNEINSQPEYSSTATEQIDD